MPVNKSKGADKQTDENVPNIIPKRIGKQKSNITFPPNMQRAKSDKNVVRAVKTVRDNVSFILLFNNCATVRFR